MYTKKEIATVISIIGQCDVLNIECSSCPIKNKCNDDNGELSDEYDELNKQLAKDYLNGLENG